jgi:hypothetical protein
LPVFAPHCRIYQQSHPKAGLFCYRWRSAAKWQGAGASGVSFKRTNSKLGTSKWLCSMQKVFWAKGSSSSVIYKNAYEIFFWHRKKRSFAQPFSKPFNGRCIFRLFFLYLTFVIHVNFSQRYNVSLQRLMLLFDIHLVFTLHYKFRAQN